MELEMAGNKKYFPPKLAIPGHKDLKMMDAP
jgi:hypothetical protein